MVLKPTQKPVLILIMLASLKKVLAEFWDYFNKSEYLEELCVDNIRETSLKPGVGGTASVHQANLTKKAGGKTIIKLVALKKFNNSIEGTEQHRARKASHSYNPFGTAFLTIVQAFVKELRNAAKLSHDNIVKIEGFYFIKGKQPVIVSEWADGGTVKKYVKENPKSDLRKIVSMNVSMQISFAEILVL